MMKCSLWLFLSIGLIGLSACSKNETSVSLEANNNTAASAASASDNSAASTQTLTSNDNKITIVVNGQYQNQLTHPDDWVAASETSSLTLLQHDDDSNITLAVNNLGAAKLNADDYFKNLAQSLKNNPELSDLKIGVATDNRMNYRFTHSVDTETLRENCIALMGSGNLYSVCAISNSANDIALASALKNISIQN
ncbi:cytochrome C [Neisseriaceae bacterium ESL0693]|nr:cytochrome C [Neisseriaceae bacterium ESL0693]